MDVVAGDSTFSDFDCVGVSDVWMCYDRHRRALDIKSIALELDGKSRLITRILPFWDGWHDGIVSMAWFRDCLRKLMAVVLGRETFEDRLQPAINHIKADLCNQWSKSSLQHSPMLELEYYKWISSAEQTYMINIYFAGKYRRQIDSNRLLTTTIAETINNRWMDVMFAIPTFVRQTRERRRTQNCRYFGFPSKQNCKL